LNPETHSDDTALKWELCTDVAIQFGGRHMATDNETYLELFDVSKKTQVGKAPSPRLDLCRE